MRCRPCFMFYKLQWLLLLQCLLRSALGGAGTYYFFCEVDKDAVVTLEWNEETMTYELTGDDGIGNTTGTRRVKQKAWKDAVPVWMDQDPRTGGTAASVGTETSFLASNNGPLHRHLPSSSSSGITSNSDIDDKNDNKNNNTIIPRAPIVQARICPCSENPHYEETAFYCTADKTYCAVPASYYQRAQAPLCLDLQSDEIFARSIWPVIMIWFCLSLVFCVCTTPGRHAVEYMIATIWPSWNDRVITTWLVRQPGRAHELWRRHWDRERYGSPSYFPWRPMGPMGGRKVEFILKTCVYHAPPSVVDNARDDEDGTTTTRHRDETVAGGNFNTTTTSDSDDDDDQRPTCSICFIPLEEGVKIGKLQCGHLFHSECIKG